MKQADLLNKGISLRQRGYSLREISERLKISKSTASLWLRQIKISKTGKSRIVKLGEAGRAKSVKIAKVKRLARQKIVADRTMMFEENLLDFSIDTCKLLLAMLYWGEGAKTTSRLDFINSDPNLIKTYLFLLRRCFRINETKLRPTIHLHEYHNQTEVLNYWSRIINIDADKFHIYRKVNTAKRKKLGYQCCLSLRYNDVNIFDEIILIIERLQKSIK